MKDLNSGAGIQHDVLDGTLDVLGPRCQPGDLVVMTHLLPPAACWRSGLLGVPEEHRDTRRMATMSAAASTWRSCWRRSSTLFGKTTERGGPEVTRTSLGH